MRRAPLAAMLLVLAMPAAVAGCGEDIEGSTGAVTLGPGQPLAIEGFEYGFKPGDVTVRGGGEPARLRLDLTNTGSLPHDVHVRRGDEELGGTKAIGGGGKDATATVELAPGDYELYCSIGDHADLGMTATLEIR